MKTTENERPREEASVEPAKQPYSKPKLTELGLLRTLTQGYF